MRGGAKYGTVQDKDLEVNEGNGCFTALSRLNKDKHRVSRTAGTSEPVSLQLRTALTQAKRRSAMIANKFISAKDLRWYGGELLTC
jgi:hypothetical protein